MNSICELVDILISILFCFESFEFYIEMETECDPKYDLNSHLIYIIRLACYGPAGITSMMPQFNIWTIITSNFTTIDSFWVSLWNQNTFFILSFFLFDPLQYAVTGWETKSYNRTATKCCDVGHCDFSNHFLPPFDLYRFVHFLDLSPPFLFHPLDCLALPCFVKIHLLSLHPLCSCLYSESVCQFCSSALSPRCATTRDATPFSIVCGCPLSNSSQPGLFIQRVTGCNEEQCLHFVFKVRSGPLPSPWSTHYPVVNLPILIIQFAFFWVHCFAPCLSVYWSRVTNAEGLSIINQQGMVTIRFKVRVLISRSVHPPRQAYMYRSVHVMCLSTRGFMLLN